ncbi:hypothetical protein AAY473_036869 [Plecturocebus cupreus]
MDGNNQYQPFQKHTKGKEHHHNEESTSTKGQNSQLALPEAVIFVSDKTDFKTTKNTRNKEGRYMVIFIYVQTYADMVPLCHPGCSVVVQSQLTAASTSHAQGIGLPQPPKVLGSQGLALLLKMECNGMVTAHWARGSLKMPGPTYVITPSKAAALILTKGAFIYVCIRKPKVQNNPELSISSEQVVNKQLCFFLTLQWFPSVRLRYKKANRLWN